MGRREVSGTIRLLAVIVAVWLSISAADADEGGPFELVTAPIPPLSMDDPAQPGFLLEMLKDLFARVTAARPDFQIEPEFALYPWSRAFKTAELKSRKLFVPLTRTPEREEKFVWIAPLLRIDFAFATIGDAVNSFEEAKALPRVAVYRDSAHETTLREKGFTNLEPASSEFNARMLAHGRVAAWFSTIPEALWQWRIQDLTPPVVLGEPVFSMQPWLVGSKDFPVNLIPEFRRRMKGLVADGTYGRIFEAYFGRPPRHLPDPPAD